MSNRKCRLCLTSQETVVEVFTEEAIQMSINEKLGKFCDVKITETDTAPRTVCFTCLNEINRFSDFYKRIQDNQKLLLLSAKQTCNDERKLENEIAVDPVEEALDIETKNEIQIEVFVEQEAEEVVNSDEDCNLESLLKFPPIKTDNAIFDQKSVEIWIEPIAQIGEFNEDPSSPVDVATSEPVNWENGSSTKNEFGECVTAETKIDSIELPSIQSKRRIALDNPIRDFFCLRCDRCQRNFETFQSLKKHIASVHGEKFFFTCCNRKLYRRDAIIEHIDNHLNPNKFKCEICNQICKSKITLKAHSKQHIPKDQQPFSCDKCGDRFALKSQLKSHMNSHLSNEEKKFVCEQCNKAFAFKFVLENHKRNMHIRQRNYMCEICARSFVAKVNLVAHKRIHDVTAPRLECPKCNALLKTNKTLKIHMRMHEPSSFPCQKCDRVYPTKNALLNHIQYTHTNRKYPCETCGRVFKKSLNLKEHMSTHTGEILYKCEYCDKTFNAKANRYTHTKKSHPAEWSKKQKLRRRIHDDESNADEFKS